MAPSHKAESTAEPQKTRERLKASVEKALEMKAAAKPAEHPAPGKTADAGPVPVENPKVRTTINPDKVGSISQQNKDAQGRKDRLIPD